MPVPAPRERRPLPAARHLYVHVPLCRTLCAYCDFSVELLARHERAGRVRAYVGALRADLAECSSAHTGAWDTIYVGGGTPTSVPPDLLGPLLTDLGARLAPGGEFTVEANPGDVDAALLTLLRGSGVTRLSLGVQTFSRPALRALGRYGGPGDPARAFAALQSVGWEDWNLDLVFGVPTQSGREATADLEAAVAAAPSHISMYDLSYSSRYAARVARLYGDRARVLAEEQAQAGYAEARGHLEEAGYRRYEVSNFALPGRESRHNLAYWRGLDYVGLGAGAVGTVGLRRWTHAPTIEGYLAGEPPQVEHLTEAIRLFERAMLGLRLAEGVPRDEISLMLDADAVAALGSHGLLENHCATLRLTPRGLDLSTAVLASLLRFPTEEAPCDDR